MLNWIHFWLVLAILVVDRSTVYSQEQSITSQDAEAVPAATVETYELNNLQFSLAHRLPGQSHQYQHRTRLQLIKKSDGKQSLIFPERNVISTLESDAFKQLVQNEDLYTIKLQMIAEDGSQSEIVTSIPACELQKSGFKEEILLYLDASGRHLIGVSYSSPVFGLSRECDASKLPEAINLQTRLKIAEVVQAQAVPLQAVGARPLYIQEAKLDSDDDGQTQQPQQQSFLRRYWYIVVVMILYLMLGSGTEPPKQGDAGQTGAAADSATQEKPSSTAAQR